LGGSWLRVIQKDSASQSNMISTFLLTLLNNFVTGILGFLPSGSLPQGLINAILYFWGALNAFSYIFPVSTLLAALLILLAFDGAVLLWHIIQWIIRKIPGMQ